MPPNEKKGKALVRSHILFKVAGPAQTYTSVEFGYDVQKVVNDDDELIVFNAARQLDELVDQLCEGRRDKAYRQLLKHISAIEAKTYRKEKQG